MNEKIVETKNCAMCGIKFEITDKDLEFYDKISPIFNGVKYPIPSPTLCPDCRSQRRLNFRNERNLFKRNCDFTGKSIISMYPPDIPYKIYSEDIWWSDNWDAFQYGKDFDFEKSFFEQFDELLRVVPQPALLNLYTSNEHSDFVNFSAFLKNSYLAYESANSQELLYSNSTRKTTNSIDVSFLTRCEECYYSINLFDCYKVFYSAHSNNCSESFLLENCTNCHYCFDCYALSDKSYYIKNKPYSKEEYFEKVEKLKNEIWVKDILQRKLREFVKYYNGENNENVSGDFITNSKNAHFCYHVKNLENGKYCSYLSSSSKVSSDCYDYDFFGGGTRIYEAITSGSGSDSVLFGVNVWESTYQVYYSQMCHNCKYLFWCVGLKNKQYCIFNKQYSKEEYDILVPKIIEHMQKTQEWGEFFPASLSLFGYNHTLAQEYFPLKKKEAIQQWFLWSDYENPSPEWAKKIAASQLPDTIDEIPDDILNWAIECERTKKLFKITPQELNFYRKHNVAIPKRHPDQRHLDRMSLRRPRKLKVRKCDGCDILTVSNQQNESRTKVLCEKCYNLKVE